MYIFAVIFIMFFVRSCDTKKVLATFMLFFIYFRCRPDKRKYLFTEKKKKNSKKCFSNLGFVTALPQQRFEKSLHTSFNFFPFLFRFSSSLFLPHFFFFFLEWQNPVANLNSF